MDAETSYTAFVGVQRLAAGGLADVSAAVRAALSADAERVIMFSDATGHAVDVDPRVVPSDLNRSPAPEAPSPAKPARGRPRLGVTAREVTLLPRHWDWLATQPGGASAALRRLVDQARRDSVGEDRRREARDVTHRVMTALAGNLPNYEAALRALYSGDQSAFSQSLADWPRDVRDYVRGLTARIEQPEEPTP
jgi:hypothetical protein